MTRKAKRSKDKPPGLFDRLTENRVPGDPFTPAGSGWKRVEVRPDGTRRYRHTGNGRGVEVWSDPWDHGYNTLTGFWMGSEWHPDVLRQSVVGPHSDLNVDQVLAVMGRLAALERHDPLNVNAHTSFAGFPAVETT